MSLLEALEAASAELGPVERARDGAGGAEWRRGGRPFAVATGDAAEFRLDPLVAAAALRTPDTSPSSRGPDWVRFAPAELDDYALDRAEAWLASGWRRAASG